MPAPEETALYDLELAGLHTRTYLISRFFDRGIHYLGPLRQKTQPVYPIQAHVRPWEVGTEGERTAAVLNLYGDEKIKYVPASTFNETGAQSPGGIPLSETTLLEGVREWLRHMGVAFDIRTEDRGKSGYSVQVQTDECGPWLDLTNVGVGVSQVLPITVMALLAKGGHVLLLEQPELHLHPSVQASLADFLLSISLAGKQCVVESHGEYLVDRLRLRIAEAHLPDIGDKTSIYFVERKQGAAQVRRVEVSEYGAILDWPEGFFDQSQREGERILLAATKKRRALRAAKEKTR
jgi:predicted ATPase